MVVEGLCDKLRKEEKAKKHWRRRHVPRHEASPISECLGKALHLEKTAERNINNLGYAYDTTLMPESEEELKRLLLKVKGECEKAGLKLNIQKSKIMASGSTTS